MTLATSVRLAANYNCSGSLKMQQRIIVSIATFSRTACSAVGIAVACVLATSTAQSKAIDTAYHEGLLAARKGNMSQARDLFLASLEQNMKDAKESRRTAQCLYQIGSAELMLGETAKASEHLQSALRIQDKLLFAEHPDILRTLDALLRLADISDANVAPPVVESWKQRKQKIELTLFNGTPDNQSQAQIWPGLTEGALTAKPSSSQTSASTSSAGTDPSIAAEAFIHQAELSLAGGHYAEAQAAYGRSIANLKQKFGAGSADLLPPLAASTRAAVAHDDFRLGTDNLHSLLLVEKAQKIDPTESVNLEQAFAAKLAQKHDISGAVNHYRQALLLSDTKSQQVKHVEILQEFAKTAETQDGQAVEAELKKEIAAINVRTDDYARATLETLSTIFASEQRYAEQESVLRKLLVVAKKLKVPDVQLATFNWMLGHAILNQKRNIASLPYFREAALLVKADPLARNYCVEYGQVLLNSGQVTEGEKVFRDFLARFKGKLSTIELKTILLNLQQACALQGKKDQADRFGQQLEKL